MLAIPLAVVARLYLFSIVLLYLLQQIVVGEVSAVQPKLEGLGKRLLGPLLGPPVGSSTRQKGELVSHYETFFLFVTDDHNK